MSIRNATRATELLAMAALAASLLSGCGSSPASAAVASVPSSVATTGAPSASPSAGGGVNVGAGNDATVPSDFPADLPLPKGTLASSVATGHSWQLSYDIANTSAATDLVARFASNSAYKKSDPIKEDVVKWWTFTGSNYIVTIGLIANGPSLRLTYLVVPVTN